MMKNNIFPILLLLAFLFFLAFNESNSESVQTKKDQKALQHEVVVVLKLVQAFVTDKDGNPITDLKKSDFILYDNDKLVTITDFEKHLLPSIEMEEVVEVTEPKPQREIPLLLNRKFFVILDWFQNDVIGVIRSKTAAKHFIETQLQPKDEVCILSFSTYRGLLLHQYLTTDHQKAFNIIDKIREIPGRKTIIPPPALPVDVQTRSFGIQTGGRMGADSGSGSGPSGFKTPITPDDFALDVGEFAKVLRYIPGQKNIILVSGGFPRSLLQSASPKADVFQKLYEKMCKELGASSCPVFTINAEGTRSHFKPMSQRGDRALQKLSDQTGGQYFADVDEYENIAEDIQNLTSNYYVLGYYIDEKWDGKYHEIEVKVKRKGCIVHAQSGYFNPKPFTDFSEIEKILHLIDLALSEKPQFQEPIRFSLVPIHCSDENQSNSVILSEIPVEKIKDSMGEKVEITSLIIDEENDIVESNKGEVDISALPKTSIFLYTIARLKPGQYECRAVIRDLSTGKGAVAGSSLVIPKRLSAGITIFPPLILIPNRPAHYLKISKAKSPSLNKIYPFISTEYSPLINEFDGTQPVLFAVIRTQIKGIEDPSIDFKITLIEQTSGERQLLPFSLLDVKKEKNADVLLIEFELPKLHSGKYMLEFVAFDVNTQSTAKSFRIFEIK